MKKCATLISLGVCAEYIYRNNKWDRKNFKVLYILNPDDPKWSSLLARLRNRYE